MALDALRSRNIIQLMGIVRKCRILWKCLFLSEHFIVFHGALIVFSALQVHETSVAIFNCQPSCLADSNDLWNKVERFLIVAPCIIAASWFFLMFWIKQLYDEFGYDHTAYRVCCSLLKYCRWVIFHVVGANPKFKCELCIHFWWYGADSK